MKKLRLTRVIASSLIVASVLALNPIGANAEWKQNSTGWWNTEGNSWSTGWRLIDGNWYYFYSNGYMAYNTTIDGYTLDSNGAWSQTSSSIITKAEAIQILMNNINYLDKPSDEDISIVSINNKEYYCISTNFTYPLSNNDGTIKYRTTSDSNRYIDIHTGILYTDIAGEFKKEN